MAFDKGKSCALNHKTLKKSFSYESKQNKHRAMFFSMCFVIQPDSIIFCDRIFSCRIKSFNIERVGDSVEQNCLSLMSFLFVFIELIISVFVSFDNRFAA